jgi:hypothetical protein
MNFDHRAAARFRFEAKRFDLRIDPPPLAAPVRAHRITPMGRATFHRVGPFDLRVHHRQSRFEVAAVEGRVGSR